MTVTLSDIIYWMHYYNPLLIYAILISIGCLLKAAVMFNYNGWGFADFLVSIQLLCFVNLHSASYET